MALAPSQGAAPSPLTFRSHCNGETGLRQNVSLRKGSRRPGSQQRLHYSPGCLSKEGSGAKTLGAGSGLQGKS